MALPDARRKLWYGLGCFGLIPRRDVGADWKPLGKIRRTFKHKLLGTLPVDREENSRRVNYDLRDAGVWTLATVS